MLLDCDLKKNGEKDKLNVKFDKLRQIGGKFEFFFNDVQEEIISNSSCIKEIRLMILLPKIKTGKTSDLQSWNQRNSILNFSITPERPIWIG